ncbi:hypothetical protein Ciccas_004844, partial [Cichlidogyrus casuarinus]
MFEWTLFPKADYMELESEALKEFAAAFRHEINSDSVSLITLFSLMLLTTKIFELDYVEGCHNELKVEKDWYELEELQNKAIRDINLYLPIVFFIFGLYFTRLLLPQYKMGLQRIQVVVLCYLIIFSHHNQYTLHRELIYLCFFVAIFLIMSTLDKIQTLFFTIIVTAFIGTQHQEFNYSKEQKLNDFENQAASAATSFTFLSSIFMILYIVPAFCIRYILDTINNMTIDRLAKAAHYESLAEKLAELQVHWFISLLPESFTVNLIEKGTMKNFEMRVPLLISDFEDREIGCIVIRGLEGMRKSLSGSDYCAFVDKFVFHLDKLAMLCRVQHFGFLDNSIKFQSLPCMDGVQSDNRRILDCVDFAISVCKLFEKFNQCLWQHFSVEVQAMVVPSWSIGCITGSICMVQDVIIPQWDQLLRNTLVSVHGYVGVGHRFIPAVKDDFDVISQHFSRRSKLFQIYICKHEIDLLIVTGFRIQVLRHSISNPAVQYINASRALCSIDINLNSILNEMGGFAKRASSFDSGTDAVTTRNTLALSDNGNKFDPMKEFEHELRKLSNIYCNEATYLNCMMRNPYFVELYHLSESLNEDLRFSDPELEKHYMDYLYSKNEENSWHPMQILTFFDAIRAIVILT